MPPSTQTEHRPRRRHGDGVARVAVRGAARRDRHDALAAQSRHARGRPDLVVRRRRRGRRRRRAVRVRRVAVALVVDARAAELALGVGAETHYVTDLEQDQRVRRTGGDAHGARRQGDARRRPGVVGVAEPQLAVGVVAKRKDDPLRRDDQRVIFARARIHNTLEGDARRRRARVLRRESEAAVAREAPGVQRSFRREGERVASTSRDAFDLIDIDERHLRRTAPPEPPVPRIAAGPAAALVVRDQHMRGARGDREDAHLREQRPQ